MSRLRHLFDLAEDELLERAFLRYSEEIVGECSWCHRAIARDEWNVLDRLGIAQSHCIRCLVKNATIHNGEK